MTNVNGRTYSLMEQVKADIENLERRRTEDLRRSDMESQGHILPEMGRLKADQINAMYDGKVLELQNELKMLQSGISIAMPQKDKER